ncbi:MAG: hypothetical protein AAB481_04465 [Patescibacteria group bacterium]
MEWRKLIYLLVIVFIGYLPYKTILRFRKNGLSSISLRLSFFMAAWFFVLSALLILQTRNLFVNVSPLLVAGFGTTVAIWFAAPRILRRIGAYPTKILADNPKWYILRAETKTFFLKFCEVFFQQAKFAYLLFEVLGVMPLISRVWWFTGIVGFLHVFNILFVPSGWFFFLVSIPMGFLFSWLILAGHIVITTTIHLWFYLILVGWYWFRKFHVTMFRNMVT